MKTLFASFCLLFSFFSSCQQKGGNFETLSVEDFVNVINDPEVQRLDVRTVAEYSEGHIPGSMNVNVLDESFAAVADSVLQLSRPVALYCRSGKRSKKQLTYCLKRVLRFMNWGLVLTVGWKPDNR